MTWYVQAGDLLLFKTDIKEIPNNAIKTKLAHKGDNHSHDFEKEVLAWDDYFFLKKPTKLVHFEHKEILLPEGFYQKKIVREFSHFDNEARNVID